MKGSGRRLAVGTWFRRGRKGIVLRVLLGVALYLSGAALWPWVSDAFRDHYVGASNAVFQTRSEQRTIQFVTRPQEEGGGTFLALEDTESGRRKVCMINVRQRAYLPGLILLVLFATCPLGGRRRLRGLLLGAGLLLGLVTVQSWLRIQWEFGPNQLADASTQASGLAAFLLDQVTHSSTLAFAAPVLIWAGIVFGFGAPVTRSRRGEPNPESALT